MESLIARLSPVPTPKSGSLLVPVESFVMLFTQGREGCSKRERCGRSECP